jgi:hypothetical protein
MKIKFLYVIFLLMVTSCGLSQTNSPKGLLNKTSSNSSKELKFMQAWIWEYENTALEEGEFGRKGEFWAYYHEELNYWLLTAESYGITGEMFNWILAKPDGTYIIDFTDEFGKNSRLEHKLDFDIPNEIPIHYKSTGNSKFFNEDDTIGFPKAKGFEYDTKYEMTSDQTKTFIGAFENVNFTPLFWFNRLDSDAKLPVHFPLDLPSKYGVFEEITKMSVGKYHLVLKNISNTEYYINL